MSGASAEASTTAGMATLRRRKRRREEEIAQDEEAEEAAEEGLDDEENEEMMMRRRVGRRCDCFRAACFASPHGQRALLRPTRMGRRPLLRDPLLLRLLSTHQEQTRSLISATRVRRRDGDHAADGAMRRRWRRWRRRTRKGGRDDEQAQPADGEAAPADEEGRLVVTDSGPEAVPGALDGSARDGDEEAEEDNAEDGTESMASTRSAQRGNLIEVE